MSVIRSLIDVSFADAAARCFYCGQPISYPYIEWLGRHVVAPAPGPGQRVITNVITLHGDCAARLAMHLGSDSVKARYVTERPARAPGAK